MASTTKKMNVQLLCLPFVVAGADVVAAAVSITAETAAKTRFVFDG
jgi:hypothetical protein